MTVEGVRDVYPYFTGPATGSLTEVLKRDSAILRREHRLRVYLPPPQRRAP